MVSESIPLTKMSAAWPLRELSVEKNVRRKAAERAFRRQKCQQNGIVEKHVSRMAYEGAFL
jgi:hypothetical protein